MAVSKVAGFSQYTYLLFQAICQAFVNVYSVGPSLTGEEVT